MEWVDPPQHGSASLIQQRLTTEPVASGAYALLDMAFASELAPQFKQAISEQSCVSLYADLYSGPDLDAIAPVLLALPSNDDDRLSLVQRLLHLTSGKPMLSIIASDLPVEALARHLQQQMEAVTSDERAWMLRFADTRSLHSLLEVFAPIQRERLMAGMSYWHYFGRDGQLVSVPGTSSHTMSDTKPYELDDRQYQRLQRIALPDALLFNIVRRPDLFGQLHGRVSTAHACIEEALKRLTAPVDLHDAKLYGAVISALAEQQLILDEVV
ncbi:hypothetical protein J2W28_005182 [Variovorax boronicumulans]|uniref:DUF4123 domain-containing protein n=1 Tax=Variovorax boronicumulans TaxID=436515 RepID=UPI0027864BFE|nr:DUF4123 domain-containing protein [Variovorax boronicumulans]MDP9994645.1 hypothetical protein [Variovorax boronicumulans]MDQ0006013.1 hypothetical protein [Variovorax boronicumulans]